jgi:uncharacterized membrane protein YesL
VTRREAVRKTSLQRIMLVAYSAAFLVLLAMMGILVTGRGPALKKLLFKIIG